VARVRLQVVASLLVLVLTLSIGPVPTAESAPATTNQWASWHWPQNPGGGYPRWVPYHDYTNASVFGPSVGVNHNMAHYYYANTNWKPYQVCGGCYGRINALSGVYGQTWYGITDPISGVGSHFDVVQIRLDEVKVLDGNKHSLVCHETGHSGGLDHRWDTSSCMYGSDAAWPPDFDAHDESVLWNIHNHID
jgi:hypothetical protein